MGGGEEDERVVPRHEMASLPLPDELLAEILLRLPAPADLVRTSAACVSFLRVATHRSFVRRKNDGGSSSQWQKVNTISLESGTCPMGSMGKYLLLYQPRSSLREAGCFTLDIQTFQREKLCALGSSRYKLHAYSNFPPSLLSSPTISSGAEKGPEEEMLEQGCAASSSAESPRSG